MGRRGLTQRASVGESILLIILTLYSLLYLALSTRGQLNQTPSTTDDPGRVPTSSSPETPGSQQVDTKVVTYNQEKLQYNPDLRNKNREFHEGPVVHEVPVEFARNFPWHDVNLNIKGSCGVDKCFWPSISSKVHGYLISSEGNYEAFRKSFDLARRLQGECDVSRLYAEPVVLVNVTADRLLSLDMQTFNPPRAKVGKKSPHVFFVKDHAIAVQKVVVAPKDHLLYGTSRNKWEAMLKDIPKFRSKITVSDFKRQLKRERDKIKCALRNEPMYWLDFQGLIDSKGTFFHMDLDGHFQGTAVSKGKEQLKIRKTLEDYDEMVRLFDEETKTEE